MSCAIATGAVAEGFPQDWTHRHVFFSHPGQEPDLKDLAAHERWEKIVSDPRFQIQAKAFQQKGHSISPPPPNGRQLKVTRDWSETMVTAATGSAAVDIAKYPAKYSFSTTTAYCDSASTPDFVVYPTGNAGSATAPSIIAYDNLYKTTCSGAVPLVYWQYNLGGGIVPSSPVLSLDGTQVAFIVTNAADTSANLGLLKWSESSTLTTLTAVSAANYRTCTAPCYTSIALSGGKLASGSSTYYDYISDSIYVGDDSGNLHKFASVFLGATPAEITSGWPVKVDPNGNALPSPIYDPVDQQVVIGDTSGYVYRVPAAGGSSIASAKVSSACGFHAPPIADVTAGTVYFGISDWTTSASPGTCVSSAVGGPGLLQYSLTFAAGASFLSMAYTGEGTANNTSNYPIILGAFDNVYFNSSNEVKPTGSIYACLQSPNPTLYQFNIANNVLSSTLKAGPNLATATTGSPAPSCVSVQEFYNGTTDYLFAGVFTGQVATAGTYNCYNTPSAVSTPVGSGCIWSFNITSESTWATTVSPSAFLSVPGGGPGGLVVDNASSLTGAEQVYFPTIMPQACTTSGTTGYCAIQASQSGLQ